MIAEHPAPPYFPRLFCIVRSSYLYTDVWRTLISYYEKYKYKYLGICSIPTFSTKVKARGLCYKHGAHGLCMHDGCSTPAHNRGLCVRHGGNGTCNKPGCTSNIRARGLCTSPLHTSRSTGGAPREGRRGTRSLSFYSNTDMLNIDCFMVHFKGHKHRSYATCIIDGCSTNASERGLCVNHGFTVSKDALAEFSPVDANSNVLLLY